MKRPIVLWLVVIFASLAVLLNALEAIGALTFIGKRPSSEVIGHVVVSVALCAASLYVAIYLHRRLFRSRTQVFLYLLFMLLIYPMYNAFRALGVYLPNPYIADNELLGAALFELLRYAVLLTLIIWVGLSGALKTHLQTPSSDG